MVPPPRPVADGRPSLDALLAAANAAPAAVPLVSATRLETIRELVTVGIKAVTSLRNHVGFILHSIHRMYPGVRVLVADDEYGDLVPFFT